MKTKTPIYLQEASGLLGITYEAMRTRVHRMKREGRSIALPDPYKCSCGHWAFDRAEFRAFIRAKDKMDKISGK